MSEKNIFIFISFLFYLFNYILCGDATWNITEFRSNPLGIARKEDFFRVNMYIPSGSRVLAYVDYNNDKL